MTRTNKYFNRSVILEDWDGSFKQVTRTVHEDSQHNFYVINNNKKHFVTPDVNKKDYTQPDVTWFSFTI